MTQVVPPQRNWFLKDEPLSDLEGQDRFSHRAYVNLLATTIDELNPPFTLAVFGSWGVGKSSIVNDLSKKLGRNGSDAKAVTIDVWKYSDNSLRRQFLYDLQQNLHGQAALPKGKDYVQEVYEEKTGERPVNQRFNIARLWVLAIPLIITSLLTGGAIWLLQSLNIPNPVQAVLAAFVAPAALYFVAEFTRNVVVVSKDTITSPVYFSEDQFERKFEEIVKDAKCEKLVIIVDNLDRCSHELVVDTLSAIKTFLEPKGEQKCIFVIPCDDGAIRQHVKAAYRVLSGDDASHGALDPEQFAIEYLRKFFSGSIKIDPFLPEEIESYIEHLLSRMKLTEDLTGEEINALVQMVGFLFRESPRQLKQFLNNLTSKYLLAKEREAGPSPQINPPITDNKLFLAKVAAIETRFPDIYRRLRSDDNLFLELHSAAVTASLVDEANRLLTDNEASALLKSFLRSSGHITADNPKAFFHLKQSEQEASIPNYAQFDSALRRGDVVGARDAYDRGNQETNAARSDVLVRDIVDWSQKGYESYALNAIRVAVDLRTSPKVDQLHISSEIVRVLATTPELRRNIHQIQHPNALFEMTRHAIAEHRRMVQDAYIELFTTGLRLHQAGQPYDTELGDSIAESLVAHITSLSAAQEGRLRAAISASNLLRPEQLMILSSTQKAIETFIESAVLRKAVGNVVPGNLATFANTLDRGDEYDGTFLALIRCQKLGDQALADETAQKLLVLLEHATNSGSDELFRYTCNVASNLSALLKIAKPTHLDEITPYLCQQYQSAQLDQKAKLVELMCRYYEQVTESTRNEIDNILIHDFIPSLPATQINGLLALHRDPNLAAVPWGHVIDQLAERLVSETAANETDDLLTSISSVLVPDDYELLMILASKILEGYETRPAVALVGQLMAVLPRNNKGKNLAVRVLSSTLSVAGHMGEPHNKKLLLEFAFNHYKLHTTGYRKKLDGHIIDLIAEGGPIQQIGFQVLEIAYEKGEVSKARYIAFLHKIARWLTQQPVTTPLSAPILECLDKIVSLTGALPGDDNRRAAMIQWLSDRQEESLPPDERRHTLGHLASFGQLSEEVLQQLVPKLVYQAQNFPDESTCDAIVASLLDLYRNNNPLNPDLWIDLHDYRRSLLSGDDMQKRGGRRVDRQMRKIRKDARERLAGPDTLLPPGR